MFSVALGLVSERTSWWLSDQELGSWCLAPGLPLVCLHYYINRWPIQALPSLPPSTRERERGLGAPTGPAGLLRNTDRLLSGGHVPPSVQLRWGRSLGDGCGGGGGRTLVGAQEDFVLGGHLSPELLLLDQELLEARSGEGEGLSSQPHQVGVLQPGVVEAVFDGGSGPGREKQM